MKKKLLKVVVLISKKIIGEHLHNVRQQLKNRWFFGVLSLLLLVACQIASSQSPEMDSVVELVKPTASIEVSEPIVLKELAFQPGHPTDMVFNSKTGYVYITNGGNAIGILEGGEQIAALPTGGRRPESLAIDEEKERVYVANRYSDSVTIIQGTEVITTIDIAGREPRDVAVEPETGWAYVVSGHKKSPDSNDKIVSGNITVISGTQKIGVIPLGKFLAEHIVVDPINSYIYVGGFSGDVTTEIKGLVVVIKGMDEVARFDIGSSVKAMDMNPQTGEMYVISSFGKLSQFKSGALIDTIDVNKKGSSTVRNLLVHPITGDVYIVDFSMQEAIVVRDMKVIGRVPLGWNPLKMDIDPISGNVYVANFSEDTVTVIQGTKVITTIDVGWYPYGIGVNPANGWVYVSNANDDTVTILGYPEQ